jgi:hypothetical protein
MQINENVYVPSAFTLGTHSIRGKVRLRDVMMLRTQWHVEMLHFLGEVCLFSIPQKPPRPELRHSACAQAGQLKKKPDMFSRAMSG